MAVIRFVPHQPARRFILEMGGAFYVNWVPMALILANFGPVKKTARELATYWLRKSNSVGVAEEPLSIAGNGV